MERNFPCPINCDKDLSIYEDFLNNEGYEQQSDTSHEGMHEMRMMHKRQPKYEMQIENRNSCIMPKESDMPSNLTNSAFFPAYLRNHIGKLIRVESLIANCLESRVGTLMQVGADYIVIKLYQSCSTMICDGPSIRYITVIHDNDIDKAGLY